MVASEHKCYCTPVNIRSSLVIVGLAALSGFASIADADVQPTLSDTGLAIGRVFPTLAFPSLESGQPVSLADFRGEKVVLQIFASW